MLVKIVVLITGTVLIRLGQKGGTILCGRLGYRCLSICGFSIDLGVWVCQVQFMKTSLHSCCAGGRKFGISLLHTSLPWNSFWKGSESTFPRSGWGCLKQSKTLAHFRQSVFQTSMCFSRPETNKTNFRKWFGSSHSLFFLLIKCLGQNSRCSKVA